MRATKRKRGIRRSTPASSRPDASSLFVTEIGKLAAVCRKDSRAQHDAGHPIVSAILRHVANRVANSKTLEELTTALDEAQELAKWLPKKPRDHIEEKSSLVVAISEQGVEPETRKQVMALLQAPGRPGDSRGIAAWALELRLQGHKWPDIEKRFLPHRRHAKNLGASVRREVQFLKEVLMRYGIPCERA